MEQPLSAIELETGAQPRFSVIWLHGLGADGSDFAPIVPMLGLPPTSSLRFIFPHAPEIPVTCNGGYVMPAWYDILDFDALGRRVDNAGILASRAAIGRLIAREVERGVPERRIVLAGFSQGGAMAYLAGLTHAQPLAGIVALSAYIPAPDMLAAEFAAVQRATPVFAAHGDDDDVVPPALGEAACARVRELGLTVDWMRYPMPHTVCVEEIGDIGRWLIANVLQRDCG